MALKTKKDLLVEIVSFTIEPKANRASMRVVKSLEGHGVIGEPVTLTLNTEQYMSLAQLAKVEKLLADFEGFLIDAKMAEGTSTGKTEALAALQAAVDQAVTERAAAKAAKEAADKAAAELAKNPPVVPGV